MLDPLNRGQRDLLPPYSPYGFGSYPMVAGYGAGGNKKYARIAL